MNKSAQDLYSELKSLQKQIEGLNVRITERLLFLIKRHPITLIMFDIDESTIKESQTENRIQLILKIEEFLTNQNPNKQLELF